LKIIPSSGGTYIVLVELAAPTTITIGKLGDLSLIAGFYAYVGSAHGPGGLAARLRRYDVGPQRLHWHIDYLLAKADLTGAIFRADAERRECSWAQWVADQAQDRVPGFGSSDCRCASHLFLIGGAEEMREMTRACGCQLKALATIGAR
jgi:Uri superfamily endonuclease